MTTPLPDGPVLPIELHSVRLALGGQTLIHDVDCSIVDRGVTAVMGPNGAGKSLLLRLMHGLLQPDAGELRWNGAPLDRNVRLRQAMIFQRPVLLRRTVRANLEFVVRARPSGGSPDLGALLQRVGLETKATQQARRLSGGEQQRLAMARAMALAPAVLLMDEPTASLDPASIAMIESLIADETAAGTKVIIVTHDLGQARRVANDVLFMHRGRITEHTDARQFFAGPASQPARDYVAGRLVM
ncbi:MAG: ATP-binding cassette domain-containing protein [Pseudomonadota bacterium]